MKKMQLLAAGLLLTLVSMAQKDPVHFTYKAERLNAKTCILRITAQIDAGWHIYSKDQPKEAISQPTKILLTKSPLFTPAGALTEKGKKEKYEDKVAEIVQYQYGGVVEYTQTLSLKTGAKATVTGNITYQACTEESCNNPQTINFEVPVPVQ